MVTAILDANVLYPAPVRDYLLHLASMGMFKPRWTEEIQEEWVRNLLSNRPDIKRRDLEKTCMAMDSAFPDASVNNYRKFIKEIMLPDPNDRHILAAAIATKAKLIVTNNLKDFPQDTLYPYSMEAVSPDDFVLRIITLDKVTALLALENQVKYLRNPPLRKEDVLRNLQNCGLLKSVAILKG